MSRPARGFTLIELMITVAIVVILAAIAYPAYTSQIAKGKRAECRSGVMQVLQQQERLYSQRNSYQSTTFSLGADTFLVRTHSGETKANSACAVTSDLCDAPNNDLGRCVQVTGTPRYTDPDRITGIRMDSNGNRGCLVNNATSTLSICWQ